MELQSRSRVRAGLGIALLVGLSAYIGGALNLTSDRLDQAVARAQSQAHTIIGQEGYEYIFEPGTQIFVDRIQPSTRKILFAIVLAEYLLPLERTWCPFLDPETCTWIQLNLPDRLDHPAEIRRLALLAAILGLMAAGGITRLTRSQPP